MDITMPLPSGEEVYDMVLEYDDIIFGFQYGKLKFPGLV